MKSLGIICACALLGWLAKRREPTLAPVAEGEAFRQVRAGYRRFIADLYADIEVEVSEFGVFVPSQDVATVAEVVAHNPAFYARVA